MTKKAEFDFPPAALEAFSGACFCLGLRKAARKTCRLYDNALAPFGLTIGQYGIMAYIHVLKGPSVQGLADQIGMDQSALSRSLKPIEKAKLIEAKPDSTDKRRRVLVLTNEGRKRFAKASRAWKSAQDSIKNKYGSEKSEHLRRQLYELVSAI